jgi:transcriptional regulator with XRE-family HTH domain
VRHFVSQNSTSRAAASGIHQSEISRIESGNGNPTLKTLGALTGALGVELSIAER